MRVEITCDNRVGILHEITKIFGDYRINVTSGELGGDSGDKVYLSAPNLLTTQYHAIEKSLLRVPGVKRVRRIALIPSERRHFELDVLLRHVADPVLSVDREGRVIAANLAAARAFGVNLDRVPGLQLQRFLPLLQVAELLRDFAVPRYGMPVAVRGRSYRLEWSPISLAESPGAAGGDAVASLAGAVLTMQPWEGADTVPDLPEPVALWDFDLRRECCLQLQEMAALRAPLLISGERGTGKSTFAAGLHYLSPLAASGDCLRLAVGEGGRLTLPQRWPDSGTLILDDLHLLSPEDQRSLVRRLRAVPTRLRQVGTSALGVELEPALLQHFSDLALRLPPLRSMRPAMERFAQALLRERERGATPISLEDAVGDHLRRHDWPDSFHGFRDYLSAAARHCRSRGADRLEVEDLPELDVQVLLPWRDWSRGLGYREVMERVEQALFCELQAENLSTRALAKRLGISHTAVANKLRKYRLSAE